MSKEQYKRNGEVNEKSEEEIIELETKEVNTLLATIISTAALIVLIVVLVMLVISAKFHPVH